MPVEYPEWITKVAQVLLEDWHIGTSTYFCEEPSDWESATAEEIAEVIWEEYNKFVAEKSQNEI